MFNKAFRPTLCCTGPLAKGQPQPAHCTREACRQLPVGTSDCHLHGLALTSSTAESSHANNCFEHSCFLERVLYNSFNNQKGGTPLHRWDLCSALQENPSQTWICTNAEFLPSEGMWDYFLSVFFFLFYIIKTTILLSHLLLAVPYGVAKRAPHCLCLPFGPPHSGGNLECPLPQEKCLAMQPLHRDKLTVMGQTHIKIPTT